MISKFRFFIICIFFTILSFAVLGKMHVYSPFSDITPAGNIAFDFFASQFSTDSIYDVNGEKRALSGDESFTSYNGELIGKYGFSNRLEFRGGVRGRRNNSYLGGTGGHDLYSSGAESFLLGTKYFLVPVKPWRYAVDLSFRRTFYSNPDSDNGTVQEDEMVLGDDGMEIYIGGALAYKGKSYYLSGTIGYNRPPNDLSDEIAYKVESVWTFFDKAAFLLGVKGVYSLNVDQYSDDPSLKPAVNSGITSLYNSVNRQFVTPYAGLNFMIGSMRVGGQWAYYTEGVSTDGGSEISLSFTFQSGGTAVKSIREGKFKEYDVEATVIKVSPRGVFLKIDKGAANAVEKGMKIDIYKADHLGKNILVASGMVYESRPNWSIVKLFKKYREKIKIKNGFVARGYQE